MRIGLVAVIVLTISGFSGMVPRNTQGMITPQQKNGVDKFGYAGPARLGPFSIAGSAGGTMARRVQDLIGHPGFLRSRAMCFANPTRGAYLVLWRGTDDKDLIRGVMVSRFRDCFGHPVGTAQHFENWATEKGIGLGSSRTSVVQAYGKPTAIQPATDYWFGYTEGSDPRYQSQVLRSLEDAVVLEYRPAPDAADLRAADFGITRGKVAWIWLYNDE